MISINDMILIVLISSASYLDLRYRKIPNKITLSAMTIGVFISIFTKSNGSFYLSLLGMFVGLAILFVPFAWGWLGAGDVKLIMAIGALKGPQFIIQVLLYTSIIGGILVIISIIKNHRIQYTMKNILSIILKPFLPLILSIGSSKNSKLLVELLSYSSSNKENYYIPYGVAIGLGTLIAFYI